MDQKNLGKPEPQRGSTGRRLLPLLLLAGMALLAYGPCLDNYFWEIDDQRHVANGAGFPFPNDYFRPGQARSFQLLWGLSGTEPLPYYLTGLGFHLLAAWMVYKLGRVFMGDDGAALLAACFFATLFAPHQAVLWIGAHLGVQETALSLTALWCWTRFIREDRFLFWFSALLAAVLAMDFKECGLNLLPWMLAVQLWAQGPRDLVRPLRTASWLPFLALAGFITWRALAVPGGVGLEAHLEHPARMLGRLLRSVGHLLVPFEFSRWRFGGTGLYFLGAALILVPLAGAWILRKTVDRKEIPTGAGVPFTLLALALLLGGHAAVLPGEPEIIGERFYYDAAPGFALLLAGCLVQGRVFLRRYSLASRLIPAAACAAWAAVNLGNLHEIEARKYDEPSRRVEALVRSTKEVLRQAEQKENLLFLNPPVPDTRDFLRILQVWLEVSETRTVENPWIKPDTECAVERLKERRGLRIFRWYEPAWRWVPFEPGGDAWLKEVRPGDWASRMNDPEWKGMLRGIEVLPRAGMEGGAV